MYKIFLHFYREYQNRTYVERNYVDYVQIVLKSEKKYRTLDILYAP